MVIRIVLTSVDPTWPNESFRRVPKMALNYDIDTGFPTPSKPGMGELRAFWQAGCTNQYE
ncbi:MAG: hypothetical protein SCALA701_36690 [Candidatus Scalindua sp.]|nr:MAG: hypothetical protein SCALA701_36690 [Candidatus Scalindua sp.]